MKEIDFLPEWYKNGIRRQGNYRIQYIILTGVFAVMIVWNFVSAGSVSTVQAKFMQMQKIQSESEKISLRLEEYKKEISVLHAEERILNSIDSKINVAGILAELSYLINERVVLSKVELISEVIPAKQANGNKPQSMSVIRPSVPVNTPNTINGDTRFKIIIDGVAANGSDVAVFLCKLEESQYFRHVDLLYAKDSEVKSMMNNKRNTQQDGINELIVNQKKENIKVSEFEINCYLANYIEPK